MNKFLKVALITAGITTCVGIGLFAAGAIATGGKPISFYWDDGFKVSTDDTIVEKQKTEVEHFKDAKIDVSAAKVYFLENTDDTFAVEYRLRTSRENAVKCEVENNKLELIENNSAVHLFSGWNLSSWNKEDLYVKIYYPKGAEFGNLNLDTSAGDVIMEQDLSCDRLTLDMSAGKSTIKNFKGALTADMSAGGLTCEDCDFGAIHLDMSAGSVKMTRCTAAGGSVDMSAGDFDASEFTLTKSLNMDMSAGSVSIAFVDGQKIGYDFDLSAGSAKINGEKRGKEYSEKSGYDVILTIDASAGSVDITNH